MLKGTLDDFTLADVFRLLSLAKRTGKLDVDRSAGTGRVFFRDGEIYYADSSLTKEPLGKKLIRARVVTEAQLMEALDRSASGEGRVGEILVSSGVATTEQLQGAIKQQIEDAVFEMLRWDRGGFSWDPGVEANVEIPIAVSVENLIMESSRRLEELELITAEGPGRRLHPRHGAVAPRGGRGDQHHAGGVADPGADRRPPHGARHQRGLGVGRVHNDANPLRARVRRPRRDPRPPR